MGRTFDRSAVNVACEGLETRRLLTTIYVDDAASGGTGTAWDGALTNLQAALATAVSGDTIKVAKGTYFPTATNDRTATFQLKSGVTLQGGYAGSTASDPDARDVAANATILSGDIGTSGSNADNSYHVVTAGPGTDTTAVLDGFTITAGNANGFNGGNSGAGLYNPGAGGVTINTCTFTANTSSSDGAGIWNTGIIVMTGSTVSNNTASALGEAGGILVSNGATLTVSNTTFSGNTSGNGGGALFVTGGTLTVTVCTFSGNTTSTTGGAIYIGNSAHADIAGSTFTNNTATVGGGAIYNILQVAPTISSCTFAGNAVTSGAGGAIANNTNASPTITESTFTGNTAGTGGAIANDQASAPSIVSCTFTRNVASGFGGAVSDGTNCSPLVLACFFLGNKAGSGGAMYNGGGAAPQIIDGVFVGNTAPTTYGGAIYNETSSPQVTNCTFTANSAVRGGAIFDNGSTATIANSVFSGNSATTSGEGQIGGSAQTVTYSLVQGGFAGTGNVNGTATFTSNPVIGTDGKWGTIDDVYGTESLAANSAGIGAGSNAALSPGIAADIIGNTRVVGTIDVGAYESTFSDPTGGGGGGGGGTGVNLKIAALTVKKPKLVNGAVVGGTALSGTFSLTNIGTAIATGDTTVAITLSADGAASSDDVVLVTVPATKLKLKTNAKKTYKFSATVPATITGSRQVIAQANPNGTYGEGSVADNALAAAAISIAAPYTDLSIVPLKAPRLIAGKPATISIIVKNSANVAFNGTVPVTLGLFDNTDGDTVSGQNISAALKLAPGKTKTFKVKLTVPAASSAHPANLTANVDPGETVNDANTADNTAQVTVSVT